ncbi:MAG: hypothetical protein J6M30_07500 [Bacteroidales bacterium]|nr:hypothetical protein [Bacteroidales bacterium]
MTKNENISVKDIKNPARPLKKAGKKESVPRWYIAECKPTKERTVRTMLKNAGYNVYVAAQSEEHIYKSRNRRTVEKIVIPGKLFVCVEEEKLMDIMQTFSSVYRFQKERAGLENQYGSKPFAFVPDNQMEQLQFILNKAEKPVFFTAENFKLNQKVKVVSGPFEGMEGWFYRTAASSYIVIRVEMGENNLVYTEIPVEDVRPIDE